MVLVVSWYSNEGLGIQPLCCSVESVRHTICEALLCDIDIVKSMSIVILLFLKSFLRDTLKLWKNIKAGNDWTEMR